MNYFNKLKYYLAETSIASISKEVKNIDIPKNIEGLSKDEMNKQYPDIVDLYNKLISTIQNASYEKSVKYINNIIKDPKLKFLLRLNTKKDFNDLQLLLNETVLPVKSLIPIQCEIGLKYTLDQISYTKDIKNYASNNIINTSIVVFNHKYIIDGHHRWCKIFMINPNARIRVINISGNISIIELLKSIQCAIAVNNDDLRLKSNKSNNIFTISEKKLYNRINKLPDKTLNDLKQIFEDPIQSLLNNCLMIQNVEKIPYRIYRNIMPQIPDDVLNKCFTWNNNFKNFFNM